jgi:hypothetical protein
MTDPDLQRRLSGLIEALAVPATSRSAGIDHGGRDAGADAQRIATAQIDTLLRRVSTLTTAMGAGNGHEWDDVDQLAARLLLADLAVIASTTRALNDLASARLESALADLRAAGVDVGRAAKDASAS